MNWLRERSPSASVLSLLQGRDIARERRLVAAGDKNADYDAEMLGDDREINFRHESSR